MQTNSAQTARDTLQRVLQEMYPSARTEIEPAAGGFVVGVTAPEFSGSRERDEDMRRLFHRVTSLNQNIPRFEDRIAVFSMYFHATARDFYEVQANLRVNRKTFDASGKPIFRRSAGDALVLAHSVDAEAVLIDPAAASTCRVIADPEFRTEHFEHMTYVQMDLGGRTFDVQRVTKLHDDVYRVYLA